MVFEEPELPQASFFNFLFPSFPLIDRINSKSWIELKEFLCLRLKTVFFEHLLDVRDQIVDCKIE